MKSPAREPFTLQLIAIDSIRPTERIVDAHARDLAHQMRISDAWTHPLLIERSAQALLDGHHRLAAARLLGLSLVPAILVDYEHPSLRLESWRSDEHFTREQVLAAAASGELMPIKSTRHVIDTPLPRCRLPLARLGIPEAPCGVDGMSSRNATGATGEPVPPATPLPSRVQLLASFHHELLRRMDARSVMAHDVVAESPATLVPHQRLRQALLRDPSMAALLPGVSCRIGLGRREHTPFLLERPALLLIPPALLEDSAALACATRWGLEGADLIAAGSVDGHGLAALYRFGVALVKRLSPGSRDRFLQGVPAGIASRLVDRDAAVDHPDAQLMEWLASRLGLAIDGWDSDTGFASELALPMESLLVEGGDSRLVCGSAGGFNRYGVPPRPRPEAVHFSSSTASAVSDYGFLFADLLRRDLLALGRQEGRDPRTMGRALSGAVGEELLALLSLDPDEADVVTCASGTDAELTSTLLALAAADGRPVTDLLVSPGESGRGVELAASGRFFDELASDGRRVSKGSPIWPDAKITVSVVAIRGSRGTALDGASEDDDAGPRRIEEIDAEFLALGEAALTRGDHVVAHLLATSKTGLSAPSVNAVETLVAIDPTRIDVVVDACQMRWDFASLGALVRRGWSVQISGSKFLTGPPFSGALVIPTAWRARAPRVRERLTAAPGTAHPADWSPWWRPALEDDLATVDTDDGNDTTAANPSRAHLFRWLPALLEARLLAMLPEALLQYAFERFRDSVRAYIADSRCLSAIDTADTADKGLGQRMIVCFQVLGRTAMVGDADDVIRALDEDDCRHVFELLNTDLSQRLGACLPGERHTLAQPCHIGQPVCLNVDGRRTTVLRLVLGARFFTTVGHAGPGAIEAALESEIADARCALEKLELVADSWWRLKGGEDVVVEGVSGNTRAA